LVFPNATHIWQVQDASGLNSAFKIAPARAKREYIKHHAKPTLEPTDLIPLLNKAWEQSFNNRKNAESAIAHCGWNPLNYNLLDYVKPSGAGSNEAIDLTATFKDDDQPPPLIVIPCPNLNVGIGSLFIDKILEEEHKSDDHTENRKKLKLRCKHKKRRLNT
jgi:hypothetical protein